jgi:chemotaxis methyl-accepting protein methylase
VNALTTNLTSFFREGYHFPVLAEHLRRLVAARGKASIWCAAASTGEEPYSLAITAIETLGAKPPVTIFASDIDTDVLAKARRRSIRSTPWSRSSPIGAGGSSCAAPGATRAWSACGPRSPGSSSSGR